MDKGSGYGRAADIWSIGCVVVEMAAGKVLTITFYNITIGLLSFFWFDQHPGCWNN